MIVRNLVSLVLIVVGTPLLLLGFYIYSIQTPITWFLFELSMNLFPTIALWFIIIGIILVFVGIWIYDEEVI